MMFSPRSALAIYPWKRASVTKPDIPAIVIPRLHDQSRLSRCPVLAQFIVSLSADKQKNLFHPVNEEAEPS
jgi:hypothetical protein